MVSKEEEEEEEEEEGLKHRQIDLMFSKHSELGENVPNFTRIHFSI